MAPTSVRSMDVVGKDTGVAKTTRSATTLAELISMVPQTWRPACGEHLTKIYRAASKLCNVSNTIAQYERHAADGSFPASIRNSLKDPKIQFSKEFLGTSEGSLAAGNIAADVLSARKSLLERATKLKREELAALQKVIRFDPTAWRTILAEVAGRAATALNAKIEGAVDSSTAPKWSGSAALGAAEDCTMLWTNGDVFHYRVIAIARSVADRSLVEKAKTLTLKKATDVEMKDADTELSTREVVRDEMQAQLRLLKQDLAKTMNQSRKSAPKSGKKGGSNPNRVTKGKPKKGLKKNGRR